MCRVGPYGTIVLPVVGAMAVAGRTLAEIEVGIANAYYPAYATTYPSVFAKVVEYRTQKIRITGAVKNPGVYDLKADQMSLVCLIMAAGGILDEGAGLIRITRGPRDGEPSENRTVQLSFRPSRPWSTRGLLRMTRHQQVLASTEIDLANRVQRHGALVQASAADPTLSAEVLDRQLASLAATIDSRDLSSSHTATLASAIVAHGPGPGAGTSPKASVAQGLTRAAMQDPQPLPIQGTYAVAGQDISDGNSTGGDRTLVLPVKGLNIPFADVALHEGDSVVVERMLMPVFTVIGLVTRPGTFPYPPGIEYNLMQAIGFAGGLDQMTDPRYAIVYRLRPDGSITYVPFEISDPKKKGGLSTAMGVLIKPGDIVAIEHTPRTRTNAFVERVFHFSVGAYIPMRSIAPLRERPEGEKSMMPDMNHRLQDAGRGDSLSPAGPLGTAGSLMPESLFVVMWRQGWIVIGLTLLALVAGLRLPGQGHAVLHQYLQGVCGAERPKIIQDLQEGVMTQSKNYLYTQAELLRATPIVSAALDQGGASGRCGPSQRG